MFALARFFRASRARLIAVTVAVGLAMTYGALIGSGSAAAATVPGEPACSLATTNGTISHKLEGTEREYLVHVPDGLSGPSVPLLIALHGFPQPAWLHERDTHWSDFANEEHFIVAYPVSPLDKQAWDYGKGSADVEYLRAVVASISRQWCVDKRHVHAEGHSSGANMSARLACDASDVFASVAGYAGMDPTGFGGGECAPGRPISVGIFHGQHNSPQVAAKHRDKWLARDGCPGTPTKEPNVEVEAFVYGPCQAGTEVVWRLYNAGHLRPTDDAEINGRMWDFFMRNPLPATEGH